MSAAFTIILPHRRNPGNDAALSIALDMLYANTVHEFILISDAAYDKPLYPRVNAMMQQATTDAVVYWASDMFPAPGWDMPMLERFNPLTFVTMVVVEPGAIAMHPDNVHKDFGRKPETFDRAAFQTWVTSGSAPIPNNFGWYAPVMYPRAGFFEFGGLDDTGMSGDHHGFTSADVALFERWKAAGRHIQRASSWCYHLQRYSQEDEQQHAKRDMHA